MPELGGIYRGNNTCTFTVWAPFAGSVSVKIVSPLEKTIPLSRRERGYWTAEVAGLPSLPAYVYRINDSLERPDPASHFQPDGVHKPSQVVDHDAFRWSDASWKGIDLAAAVIYELHVGTFTPEGTFAGVVSKIPHLKELGVTLVELMPVSQFPGGRNWGYDGTYPFAVQNSYGGPQGLKELVDACHAAGIGVALDVVYNHFGPEGCYVRDFGPYFTSRYRTLWGDAVNYDDACSDEVREFFCENALFWFSRYHIDVLRLDAVHSLFDFSARPFLQKLAERTEALSLRTGKKLHLIAESDLNDSRLLRPRELGGYALDAQWLDDFHHSLHALLTGEKNGYYGDFGKTADLARSLREGYVYAGEYSAYRKRSHGNRSSDIASSRFVVFSQNHDQTGNRMAGERLSSIVSFESLKLAAGTVLLSPCIPLLFMGEEFGETNPFLYFVSHGDRDLIEAVRNGRKQEFKDFITGQTVPDPQSPASFASSRLDWAKPGTGAHAVLLAWYRRLLELRRTIPALSVPSREGMSVDFSEQERQLLMERRRGASRIAALFNFGEAAAENAVPLPQGAWRKVLSSADAQWRGEGDGTPERATGGQRFSLGGRSLVLYANEGE